MEFGSVQRSLNNNLPPIFRALHAMFARGELQKWLTNRKFARREPPPNRYQNANQLSAYVHIEWSNERLGIGMDDNDDDGGRIKCRMFKRHAKSLPLCKAMDWGREMMAKMQSWIT